MEATRSACCRGPSTSTAERVAPSTSRSAPSGTCGRFAIRRKPLPSRDEIEGALELVDASRIELDQDNGTAYLPVKGMKVNLGAIGKGYAAELAIETMRRLGIRRAAVGAGGDLYLLGRKSTGPWVVDVEEPAWPGRYVERFIAGDLAVATSGTSQRYVIRAGKRFGHILDPRTGYPAAGCQSVTVLAADSTAADAYATAVFVMGPRKGMRWVEVQPGVEALIVNAAGEKLRSSGWRRMTGDPWNASRGPSDSAAERAPEPVAERARTTPPSRAPVGRSPNESPNESPDETLAEMVTIPVWQTSSDDEPVQRQLPAFRIDRTEVTNRAYARFLQAVSDEPHRFCHPDEPEGKDHLPRYWREFRPPLFRASVAARLAPFDADTFRDPSHPVVGVDWWDANAFARWAGKRLPTRRRMGASCAGSGWSCLAVG